MMMPDLNKVIDRNHTNCSKWDFNLENFGTKDVLPMWVADMDFPAPPAVTEALIERAKHPIYGYSRPDDDYYNLIIKWMKNRHGWEPKKEWITYAPGIVPALNWLIQSYSNPGDKVIIQQPVYYPFSRAIRNNGRQMIDNPLILKNGKYFMDFEDLEKKVDDPRVKIFILCSPHNPVGRVWTREELMRLGEICFRRQIIVISDEIHSDLIFKGHRHIPFASISEKFMQNSIVCHAPSKTFNLAGLQVSNIMIPNRFLRDSFRNTLANQAIKAPNCFAIPALKAAYREGEQWLDTVMEYIENNYLFLEEYIRSNMSQIKVIRPEGTYLVWMDFRDLGMSPKEEREFMLNRARVAFDDGPQFGPEGNGFERINIACPRSILQEGLERIQKAIGSLKFGG
jgi:cystathionine beta-lyase